MGVCFSIGVFAGVGVCFSVGVFVRVGVCFGVSVFARVLINGSGFYDVIAYCFGKMVFG